MFQAVLFLLQASFSFAYAGDVKLADQLKPGQKSKQVLAAGKDKAKHALQVEQRSVCPKEDEPEGFCQDIFILSTKGMPRQRLLQIDHDLHDTATHKSQSVFLGNNVLTHATSGGANWRWSAETVYRIAPFGTLSERRSTYHITSPDQGRSTNFNYASLSGTAELRVAFCGAADELVKTRPIVNYESHILPYLADSDHFEWRTTGIQNCSVPIDTPLQGAQAQAHVRVLLLTEREAVVDVLKPAFTKGDLKLADHLELWISGRIGEDLECTPPARKKARMAVYLIGPDGSVQVGAGDAITKPVVDTAPVAGGLRFHVSWPEEIEFANDKSLGTDDESMLSFAWVEGDGRAVSATIATSQLKAGDALSLGFMRKASCVIERRNAVATLPVDGD